MARQHRFGRLHTLRATWALLALVAGDKRLMVTSLVLNWVVGPALMFALAWLLRRGDELGLPVVPIPGTRTPSRVDENAGACAVAPRLTAGHLARLDTAADVVTGDRNIVSDPRWISSGRE